MEKKNNNIKIVAIVLLVLGLLLIVVAILLSFMKNDENTKDPVPTKKYSSLLELAQELYDNKSYKNLAQDKEKGMYYMTLDEFKKRGYNQDIVDVTCPGDLRVLNFNFDDTEEFSRFYAIDNCNELKDDDPETMPKKSLMDIANELYENNEYLNLTKGEGGYYMTIGMYKSKGYDTSLINPECTDDSGVLFFDIDNKDKYESNPVFTVYECNQPK